MIMEYRDRIRVSQKKIDQQKMQQYNEPHRVILNGETKSSPKF